MGYLRRAYHEESFLQIEPKGEERSSLKVVYKRDFEAERRCAGFERYGYQSKESLDEEGLDTYDFFARYYDPALGRFTSVDPAASSFSGMSPYLGMGGNPNIYVDPDGRFITWSVGKGGFSVGFNLTPVGIPVGGGINVGWQDGFSAGPYREVAWRVGGDGLGAGTGV